MKKVLVIGLAKSGFGVAKLLKAHGYDVTVNENKPVEQLQFVEELKELDIKLVAGGHPDELLDQDYEFIVKNPGIPYKVPFIQKILAKKIPLYTEVEVAYRLSSNEYIGITGTNGKTTTTTLAYEMLHAQFDDVMVGGNIGTPLSELVMTKENQKIVIELSNFQLMGCETFKPHVATVLNLSPDHLDYMNSLDEYYQSKMKIYENQDENDYFIMNSDDQTLHSYAKNIKSKIISFSIEKQADCMIKDQAIYYMNEKIIDIKDIKVVGVHNIQNIMVAIIIASLYQVKLELIQKVIRDFRGVEHRIEFVKEIDGVAYYNDSKATTPDATIVALKSFEKDVILLLGGKEKGLDFDCLLPYMNRVKKLITFGEIKKRITYLHPEFEVVDCLDQALERVKNQAIKGDTVLLSPATSSYDQFDNYEQRGRYFKQLVNSL